MKKIFLLIPALIVSTNLAAAQTVDDLEFLTEYFAPLNYEKEGVLHGIAVETLGEMLKLLDTKKTVKDIKLWPWSRGYKSLLEKKNTVLFSTNRTEAREKLFKWVGPIAPSHIVLVAKKGRGIKINSPEDINKYKTGVVRDDVGEQLLLQFGVKKENLRQTNSGISTAKNLKKDRIDMWAYGVTVVFWTLQSIGENPRDYEVIYSLKRAHYYYAIHKDTDDRVVAELQDALDKLKANGKLEKIVKKYSP